MELRQDGDQLLHKFISERLEGEVSIWDPVRRRKLPTLQINAKTINIKLKDQVVTIREEQRLLARFVVASRERPEIDLLAYLGKYEFSVVPRSMFLHDGTIHLASDKSSMLHEIEKVVEVSDITEGDGDLQTVIIFNGMALISLSLLSKG